jgi:hypothetical protein
LREYPTDQGRTLADHDTKAEQQKQDEHEVGLLLHEFHGLPWGLLEYLLSAKQNIVVIRNKQAFAHHLVAPDIMIAAYLHAVKHLLLSPGGSN